MFKYLLLNNKFYIPQGGDVFSVCVRKMTLPTWYPNKTWSHFKETGYKLEYVCCT